MTDQTVAAGDYTLAESGGPDGYTSDGWTCTGADVSGSTVTIGDGDEVVCTVVNRATGTEPTPGPTPEPTGSPTPTPDPTGSPSPTPAPSGLPTPTPSSPPPAGSGGDGSAGGPGATDGGDSGGWTSAGGLAYTGSDPRALGVMAAVLLATGLVLASSALRARRRGRRDPQGPSA